MITALESTATRRTRSALSAEPARFTLRSAKPSADAEIRALVEAGRVQVARRVADMTGSTRWQQLLAPPAVRATAGAGPSDFVANMAWVGANRAMYAGQWVALREGQLVQAAADLRTLRASLDQAGPRKGLFVTRVPA